MDTFYLQWWCHWPRSQWLNHTRFFTLSVLCRRSLLRHKLKTIAHRVRNEETTNVRKGLVRDLSIYFYYKFEDERSFSILNRKSKYSMCCDFPYRPLVLLILSIRLNKRGLSGLRHDKHESSDYIKSDLIQSTKIKQYGGKKGKSNVYWVHSDFYPESSLFIINLHFVLRVRLVWGRVIVRFKP